MSCQVQIRLPTVLGEAVPVHSAGGLIFAPSLETTALVSLGLLATKGGRQSCKQRVKLFLLSHAPTFQPELVLSQNSLFQERYSHPEPDLGANLTAIMHNSLITPFLPHLIVFIPTSIQSRRSTFQGRRQSFLAAKEKRIVLLKRTIDIF